jgi:hypothetical protein
MIIGFIKEKYRKAFFKKYPNKNEIDFFREIIFEPYKEMPVTKTVTDNILKYEVNS